MTLNIAPALTDFDIADLANEAWSKTEGITIDKYWSGNAAPPGRHVRAYLLWSENALYIRFDAAQAEPLIVNDAPDTSKKIIGLWDRDVCEIFIAPNADEPRKYFEFEVAPTGEWIDLTIDLTTGERITDWDYSSGMQSAADIGEDRVVMAMKIPWTAFGRVPQVGDIWLGNLFRCVGSGSNRGYLAWKPTFTPEPAFHSPEAFGEFHFLG